MAKGNTNDYSTIKRIEKLAQLVKGKRVLDVGCREGIFKKFLPQDIEYYGLEKGDCNFLQTDSSIKTLSQGITDPKVMKIFGNIKFDTIILAETLEHLPDPVRALKYIKFLLKDNGQLVGSVPNALAWRYFFFLEFMGDGMRDFSHPQWDGHEHFFTFNKLVLKTLLMYAGFKIKSVKEWGNWIPLTRIFLPFHFRGAHLVFVAEK